MGVYDSTNRDSFDHVEQWMGQVQQHHECGPSTVKILIGNKADMVADAPPHKVVSEEEGRAKAETIGAFFISTSAKTAVNVDLAFLTAAQQLVESRRKQKQQPKTTGQGNIVNLGAAGPSSSNSSSSKPRCACAAGM